MPRTTVRLLGLLALGVLFVSLATEALALATVHRIGILSSAAEASTPLFEAFRQGLRALGYVEGHNMVLEFRLAAGRAERLRELAAELVQLQVDVIVAGGAPAIQAAQHATRTLPIVMAGTSDAVAQGFIASLARPGGNITGLSDLSAELHGKRLELLKETVPQSVRIAVLANPASPYHASRMHNLTVAAQTLGLHLHVVEVRHPDELARAFAALPQAHVDALLVVEDALVLSTSLGGRLANFALTSRLPAMYGWREYVDAGGLMAYGPSFRDIYRRAAIYVDKILKGATPADLPVEQPTKFELVINLKAAHALQDAIQVEQARLGKWEVPNWDPKSQEKSRDALAVLGSAMGDTPRYMFGTKSEVEPIHHLMASILTSQAGIRPGKNASQKCMATT